jgi:hypothetical protein
MQLSQQILLRCLALHYGKKGRARFMHSRNRKDFFKTLSIEEWRRWYQQTSWCALIQQKLPPWQKLLHSQNDQAYITMMGFDAMSFDRILEKFGPMYSGHTTFDPSGMIVEFEYTSGWKREVQPKDCLRLVLVLMWTRTRGPLNVLQLVFRLTYSNLCIYLRFGIRIFVETFWNVPLARVSIPSWEEVDSF